MKKLVYLAVATVLITGCTTKQSTESDMAGVITLTGQPITLNQVIDGQPAIINFWASWCAFCKDELPLLESVQLKYEGRLKVVGVNLQEDPAVARAYLEQGGYSFANLLDPVAELKAQYGVFTQPTTMVLQADGTVLTRKDGPFTEAELQAWAEQLAGPATSDSTSLTSKAEAQTSPSPALLKPWYGDRVNHLIDLDLILSGGPPKDGIPALDEPEFILASDSLAGADDLTGILVAVKDETRFYPFAILNWHEIVNDTIKDLPVSITYCPLCASAVVYQRTTSQGVDTLGVSGFLYQSNLLMYDRQTDSLWDQITGQAVVGPLTGERLKRVKSDIVSLGTVKANWPHTKVLTVNTGYRRDYNRDPYAGYESRAELYFPVSTVDERLPGKTLVYGLEVDGLTSAYTLADIRQQGRIQDTLGEIRILIQHDPATDRVRFTRFLEDDTAVELTPIYTYWFSWVAQYPGSLVYGY